MPKPELKTPARLLYVNPVIMWIMASLMAFFGFQGRMIPFLEKNLGRTSAELEPGMLSFMLLPLFWIIASLLTSYGVALFIMTKGPFQEGEKWAYKAIFGSLAVWLPLVETAALIKFPYSPWAPFGLCIICTLIAFVMARPHFK